MPVSLAGLDPFVDHLRSQADRFVVRRAPPKVALPAADLPAHVSLFEGDAEFYALRAVADGVLPGQRARVLFALLARPRADLAPDARNAVERVVVVLLRALKPSDVLSVFLALRRHRVGH